MRAVHLVAGAAVPLILASACGAGDSDTEPEATPATVTVTAEPEAPSSEPTQFVPQFADVADFVNANLPDKHPLKGLLNDDNAELDGALGDVCIEVDDAPLRPRFRAEVAEGLHGASGQNGLPDFSMKHALIVYDTIVEGCFATGHATRYVKPVPTITEGAWTVGRDFPAGTYRSDGDFAFCYWEITRSGSNGQDIVANDNLEGGRPTVTLARGQDFQSQDCGTWTKID